MAEGAGRDGRRGRKIRNLAPAGSGKEERPCQQRNEY